MLSSSLLKEIKFPEIFNSELPMKIVSLVFWSVSITDVPLHTGADYINTQNYQLIAVSMILRYEVELSHWLHALFSPHTPLTH